MGPGPVVGGRFSRIQGGGLAGGCPLCRYRRARSCPPFRAERVAPRREPSWLAHVFRVCHPQPLRCPQPRAREPRGDRPDLASRPWVFLAWPAWAGAEASGHASLPGCERCWRTRRIRLPALAVLGPGGYRMSTFRPLRVRHRRSLLTWRSSFRRPVAKRKRRPRLAPSLGSAGHSIGGKGGADHRSGWPGAESGAVPRIRLDAGRRGVVAVGLALLLVAAATAWWVFLGRPRASAVPVITSARGSVASTSAAAARPGSVPASVVVDVVGKVKRPGVYRLHSGARVADAVQAAGGTMAGADLSSTNLARRLVDGEQIAVGLAPAQAPGITGTSAGVTGSSGLIDLNTATAEQLDALPGVGPVLAQHILDWRSAHGRFDSADQLREVSGIGPSKFADLRPLVTV